MARTLSSPLGAFAGTAASAGNGPLPRAARSTPSPARVPLGTRLRALPSAKTTSSVQEKVGFSMSAGHRDVLGM